MKAAAPCSRTAKVSSSTHCVTPPPVQRPSSSRVVVMGPWLVAPTRCRWCRHQPGLSRSMPPLRRRWAVTRQPLELRQSARCPGIHPSAWRPVTAKVFGPSAPTQIGGVGAAAGVNAVTL